MKRKWLSGYAAAAVMMILLTGCGDTDVEVSEGSEGVPNNVEVQTDTVVRLTEDVATQDVMGDSEPEQETSDETKLLYRVYYYLPDDTDPEDGELVYEYAYDESGTLINKKEYRNNTIIFEYVYEHGQTGELLKSTEYFKGDLYGSAEYVYDASGYLVRENHYGPEGDTDYHIEYENDTYGNILKEVSYGPDGSIISSVDYTYDASGNRTKERSYEVTYHDTYDNRVEYTYDVSGNLLKETSYTNGRFYHYNAYAYDPDGNLTRKEDHFISSLDESDTLNDYYEYTYDEEGYLLTAVMYDRDGNVFFDEVNQEIIKGYRYEYILIKNH